MEKRFFGVPDIFPASMVLCRNVSVLADYRVLKKVGKPKALKKMFKLIVEES